MGLLKSKVALITGGTTGIGLATAQRFMAEGATVIVTGRDSVRLAAAQERLGEAARVWASDAADEEQVKALFARVKEEFTALDVLFVNAGVAKFAPLQSTPVEVFDQLMSVNLRGAWMALKYGSPVMADHGSVVVNSSALHSKGFAGASAYSATKAGMRSLVRTMAVELANRGVRVNCLSPGPIDTPIYSKLGMPAAAQAKFERGVEKLVPLGRFGRAEEVAGAALFLASGLSSFVTGVDLPVDGGMAQV